MLLHRLFLYLEHRGWIYYTKQSRPPGMAANAFLHVEALVNPPAEHVIEIRRLADLWKRQETGEGDPDIAQPGAGESIEIGGQGRISEMGEHPGDLTNGHPTG